MLNSCFAQAIGFKISLDICHVSFFREISSVGLTVSKMRSCLTDGHLDSMHVLHCKQLVLCLWFCCRYEK